MKKLFLLIAVTFFTFFSTSCKSEPKVEAIEEVVTGTDQVQYTCPMDCEKGKTYAEKGKCPVCEMDLIASSNADTAVDTDRDHDDHEGHNH